MLVVRFRQVDKFAQDALDRFAHQGMIFDDHNLHHARRVLKYWNERCVEIQGSEFGASDAAMMRNGEVTSMDIYLGKIAAN